MESIAAGINKISVRIVPMTPNHNFPVLYFLNEQTTESRYITKMIAIKAITTSSLNRFPFNPPAKVGREVITKTIHTIDRRDINLMVVVVYCFRQRTIKIQYRQE